MFHLLADNIGGVTPPVYTTSDTESLDPVLLTAIILAVVALIFLIICVAVLIVQRKENANEETKQEKTKAEDTEFENLTEEEKQLLREHRKQKSNDEKQ